jgi:hypothetical protein
MLVSQVAKLSPLPAPLGVAFATVVFGKGTLGARALPWVGLALHVGYVGGATVAYVVAFRSLLGARSAFLAAGALWILAGLVFAPVVGWGFFAVGLGVGAVLNVLAVHVAFAIALWSGSWLAFRTAR